jgi:hypothetical protein
VDPQVPQTHLDLVLVNDYNGLAARHIQAAPDAVKGNRYVGLWTVQYQASIGRDPQLAGHTAVTLPQHLASFVQTQARLPTWKCYTAQVLGLGLGIQVFDADCNWFCHFASFFLCDSIRQSNGATFPVGAGR